MNNSVRTRMHRDVSHVEHGAFAMAFASVCRGTCSVSDALLTSEVARGFVMQTQIHLFPALSGPG